MKKILFTLIVLTTLLFSSFNVIAEETQGADSTTSLPDAGTPSIDPVAPAQENSSADDGTPSIDLPGPEQPGDGTDGPTLPGPDADEIKGTNNDAPQAGTENIIDPSKPGMPEGPQMPNINVDEIAQQIMGNMPEQVRNSINIEELKELIRQNKYDEIKNLFKNKIQGQMGPSPEQIKQMDDAKKMREENMQKRQDERKRGPPEKLNKQPPTEIPPQIIEAGAEQDFLDLMCAMMKYHMQDFFISVKVIKENFTLADSEFDFIDLSSQLGKIDDLQANVTTKQDALCVAAKENFVEKMNEVMNAIEGPEGMDKVMSGIGDVIESQMTAKMGGQGQQMEEQGQQRQQQGEQMQQQIGQQMQELQSQMQEAQAAGDMQRAQELGQQMQQIGSSAQQQGQQEQQMGEQAQQQGESMRAEGEKIGKRMEELFGGMEAKIEEARKSGGDPELKRIALEKQKALFLKVFAFQITKIEAQRDALKEKEDFDVAKFDELIALLKQKQAEASAKLTVDSDEAEFEAFMLEMEKIRFEWQGKIEDDVREQSLGKFMSQAQQGLQKLREGIRIAKANDYDTTEMEAQEAELRQAIEDGKALIKNAKSSEDMVTVKAKLMQTKEKFEKLKLDYNELRVQKQVEKALKQNNKEGKVPDGKPKPGKEGTKDTSKGTGSGNKGGTGSGKSGGGSKSK